jgi:hypothetical protein
MPEATGLVKVTNSRNLINLIYWYFKDTKSKSDNEIYDHFNKKNK